MGNQQTISPDMFNNTNMNQEFDKEDGNNTLLVKTYTWSRDSHGLYDYKGQNTFKQDSFKIKNSGKIIRQDEQIKFQGENQKEELRFSDDFYEDYQHPLLNINKKNNLSYTVTANQDHSIFSQNNILNEQSMWLIVRSLKNIQGGKNGCELKENDYIKLGRVRFRISEINTQQDQSNDTQSQQQDSPTKRDKPATSNNLNKKGAETQGTVPKEDLSASEDEVQMEGKACRFCLSDMQKKDDPLMCPCKCSGSVQYVHIQCLKMWLQNKITSKESPYSTQYSWKDLKCELCQYQYPHTIYENGVPYQTFNMKKPNGPYIVMEVLCKDNNISKGIHIISMAQKSVIKIGRGSDSDMKVQDISVSRCHASIKLKKGKLYLEDLNSKFGTLALIKSHIDISSNTNKIAIQVNRTVFSFYMQQIQQKTSICGGKQKQYEDFQLNPPETMLKLNVNKIQDPVLQQIEEDKKKQKRIEELKNLQRQIELQEEGMLGEKLKILKVNGNKKSKLKQQPNSMEERNQFYSKNMENFDQILGNKNQDMILFDSLNNNKINLNQYQQNQNKKTLFQEQKENEKKQPRSYTNLNMNDIDNQYPPLEQFKQIMKSGNVPDAYKKMAGQFNDIPENNINQNNDIDHDFQQIDIEEKQIKQSTIYSKNMHANNLGYRLDKNQNNKNNELNMLQQQSTNQTVQN